MSTKTQSLANRRIAITRASDQSGALRERLVALGAETIELPLIKVSSQIDKNDLADCMLELGSYDWIIFTSANGVRCFFDQFFKLFDDIRSLGLIRVACIGEATAEALAPLHLKIECMPKKATAEALASALEATGSLDSAKVLLVTGNLNRETLEKKLEEARAIVDRLPVYKTERNDISADNSSAQYRKLGADAMLFASSSAVESYLAQHDALSLSPAARVPLFGSIGPQTSESMRKGGIKIDFEAESPSLDDLVDALVKALGKA